VDANTVRQGVQMLRIDPGIFQVADEFLSNPIAARKRKARSKRLAADKPTILVVDDHEIIADTTAEILNRFGFRAVRTYHAQTALQIAAKLKPDFLLTDVSMPIMNGVELAIEITELLPATKILLFSGQAGTQIFARGRRKRLGIRTRCQSHPSRETDGTSKKNDCNHTLTEDYAGAFASSQISAAFTFSVKVSVARNSAARPPKSHVRS
jgi:CheY-like chemotaxis protein